MSTCVFFKILMDDPPKQWRRPQREEEFEKAMFEGGEKTSFHLNSWFDGNACAELRRTLDSIWELHVQPGKGAQ